jgi:ADP-dependent NAD(P)H-hydrate dehydratase / NAD(P)H-hydrate epimerase
LQRALHSGLPLVVDADALNLLAQDNIRTDAPRDNWIFTPHPGEAATLLYSTTGEVQSDRFAAVQALHIKFGGAMVLKGAGTLVCSDGSLGVAQGGNPGMATAGMGDVLSGVLGGLLAQGLDVADAAMLGVQIHNAAGDLAAFDHGERGMLATDLLPYLQQLVNDES